MLSAARRRLAPLLVGLPLLACGGGAPDGAAPPAGNAPPGPAAPSPSGETEAAGTPELRFERLEHDFGKVSDLDQLHAEFPFRNEGDGRLVISEVKASCGCTATKLTRTEFGPGEGDSIGVDYHPIGRGPQGKTITVRSNDPKRPTIVLRILSDVQPFVEFQPMTLQFGTVEYGRAHTAEATFRCVDPDAEVLAVESLNRHMAVQITGRDPDGTHHLQVTILETAPWGGFTTNARVRVRGRREPGGELVTHEKNLVVHADLYGKLRLERSILAVGRVEHGKPFETRLRLTHVDGEPFQVVSVQLLDPQPPGLTARAEPVPASKGGGVDLVVSGSTGTYEGLIRGRLRFLTDIPGEPEHEVPVMGKAVP